LPNAGKEISFQVLAFDTVGDPGEIVAVLD
jgi:hypothetical protein